MTSRARKKRQKKPRLENLIEEDDDDLEFIVDKFDDEDYFISFENENKSENARFSKHAKHCMKICIRIIPLMTNSTREIFLMT